MNASTIERVIGLTMLALAFGLGAAPLPEFLVWLPGVLFAAAGALGVSRPSDKSALADRDVYVVSEDEDPDFGYLPPLEDEDEDDGYAYAESLGEDWPEDDDDEDETLDESLDSDEDGVLR